MLRQTLFVLAAVTCLGTAPLLAQDHAAAPPRAAVQATGPRVQHEYPSYQPQLAQREAEAAAAAAASRTTITITTLGLVLLIVLLVILLA